MNIDTSRLMFAGHSYGGSAIINLAVWAHDQGWGSNVLAIHSSAPYLPRDSASVTRSNLARLDQTKTTSIFQIYEHDDTNDHNIAQFFYNNTPGTKYWYTVYSSPITAGGITCRNWADHYLAGNVNPYSPNFGAATYGKLGAALAVGVFRGDTEGLSVIAGGAVTGTVTQNGVVREFKDMGMALPPCGKLNHDARPRDDGTILYPAASNLWGTCS